MFMTLDEIKDYITSNDKFKVTYNGSVGYSAGVLLAIENNKAFNKEVEKALQRFENKDFGTFYDWDETPTEMHEYGCYDTSIGELFIHTDVFQTVIYFQFER